MDILILRDDLDQDYRVIHLARILDIEVDTVIGKLWRFWRYAKRNAAQGGSLDGCTSDMVDGIAECVGFSSALVRVGWLKLYTTGAEIPNFEEWISKEAMAALLRQAAKPTGDHPGFDEFWAKYPRKEGKKNAKAAWNKLRPTGELLIKVMGGLARWVKSDQWAGQGVIPHASTWLNGWRWEDEIHGHGRAGVGGNSRVVAEEGKYAAVGAGGEEGEVAAVDRAVPPLLRRGGEGDQPDPQVRRPENP